MAARFLKKQPGFDATRGPEHAGMIFRRSCFMDRLDLQPSAQAGSAHVPSVERSEGEVAPSCCP